MFRVISATAIALFATPAGAVNLKEGAYVDVATLCGVASNSTLEWFHNNTFYAGRANPTPVKRMGDLLIGTHANFEAGQAETEKWRVLSATSYVQKNQFGTFKKRWCSYGSLPGGWSTVRPWKK